MPKLFCHFLKLFLLKIFPSTEIVPFFGVSNPQIISIIVDFPPDGRQDQRLYFFLYLVYIFIEVFGIHHKKRILFSILYLF